MRQWEPAGGHQALPPGGCPFSLDAGLLVESDSQDSLAGWLRTLVTMEMARRDDRP